MLRCLIFAALFLIYRPLLGQNAEDAAKFNEVRFALEKRYDYKTANQILNEMSETSKNDPLFIYFKMRIYYNSYCVACRNVDSAIYFTEKYLLLFPSSTELHKQLVELKYQQRLNEEERKTDSLKRKTDSLKNQELLNKFLDFQEKTFVKKQTVYGGSDLYDTLKINIKSDKIYLSFSNYLSIWNQKYSNHRILNKLERPRVYYSAVIDFPKRYTGNGSSYIEISTLFTLGKVTGKIPDKKNNLKPILLEGLEKKMSGTISLYKTHVIHLTGSLYDGVTIYPEYSELTTSNTFMFSELGFK